MPFTRSLACSLAAVDEQQFKTLDRRGQLAIRDRATIQEEDLGQRWPRMNAQDVVQLAVQGRLMDHYGDVRGISPETAKMIVSNTAWFIAETLAQDPREDAWLGYASKPHNGHHAGGHVTGSIMAVAQQIDRDGPDSGRVYLLNLSKVIREVHARAASMKVSFE